MELGPTGRYVGFCSGPRSSLFSVIAASLYTPPSNMAAPCFGFSVGDFISAIQLIIQVNDALRATSTIDADCRSAVTFLGTVQHTLQSVYDLPVPDENAEAFQQIRTCALLCCERVVNCLQRIRKFKVVLTEPTHSSVTKAAGLRARLKKNAAKVEWSLRVRDDLTEMQNAIKPQLSIMQLYLQLAEHYYSFYIRY